MEKSALDILVEYAEKNNYKPYSHQNEYRVKTAPVANSIKDKFVLFEVKENFWFLAIDERYSTDSYGTKSGVYRVSDSNSDFICKIEKKFIFDRLKFNSNRTGVREIDKALNFKSNMKIPPNFISKSQMKMFLEINEKLNPSRIMFQNDYLKKVKVFSNKYIIGVEVNNWLYEEKEVSFFIDKSLALLETFDLNL